MSSSDPDARSLPSGENATDVARSEWPFRVLRQVPVAGSHSLSVFSVVAAANHGRTRVHTPVTVPTVPSLHPLLRVSGRPVRLRSRISSMGTLEHDGDDGTSAKPPSFQSLARRPERRWGGKKNRRRRSRSRPPFFDPRPTLGTKQRRSRVLVGAAGASDANANLRLRWRRGGDVPCEPPRAALCRRHVGDGRKRL